MAAKSGLKKNYYYCWHNFISLMVSILKMGSSKAPSQFEGRPSSNIP